MTSNPASRSARATTLAPRSCPSSPGLATTTRYWRSTRRRYYESSRGATQPTVSRVRACSTTSVPLHPLVEEWDAHLTGDDPLDFPGYRDQLARAGRESVVTGRTAHYAVIEGC